MNPLKKTIYILDAQSLTALTTARAIEGSFNCVGIHLKGCENYSSLLSKSWSQLIPIVDLSIAALNVLIEIAKSHALLYQEKPILLTATDDGVLFLSEHEKTLSEFYIIPIPDVTTLNTLMDKSLFYQWAAEHNLPIVKTALCENDDDLHTLISNFPLPFILKPKVRMHLWNTRFPQEKILTITTEDERKTLLAGRLDLLKEMGGIIVQKLIPGGDENIYFVLVAFDMAGRLSGSFSGQKLAQWPPKGGSTLVCVKCDDPALAVLANNMFGLLPMRGLASVEYKKCAETGVFYIIEPTVGRCDHQSLLAEYSNVNLVVQFLNSLLELESLPSASIAKHRVWIDEISFVRLMRADIKLALHVMHLIGYANLWRLRPLLFRLFDIKPFARSFFNLVGVFKK
jgi:D-aspartate ligase